MTDMRRTLLWVVFLSSLAFLWDGWNKYNGRPSMFSPAAVTKPVASGSTGGGLPAASSVGGAAVASPSGTSAVMANVAASAPVSEKVTITTDLVKATLDSSGGDLVRLELLKEQERVEKDVYHRVLERLTGSGKPEEVTSQKNVVVMDRSTQRLYVAQSGLVPLGGGAGLPNHHTVMNLVPGERSLKDGANDVQVKFESPEVGGVKLVKTYTFKRGDYVIDVKHEVVNNSGAPVNPRLYLQLVTDGAAPGGGSSFYSTFTGPAIYDEAAKFHKVEFKSIDKGNAEHETQADNGWVAMVQHYFASAWLIDKGDGSKQPREFFTGTVDMNNFYSGSQVVPLGLKAYSVGMFVPIGEVGAGAAKTFDARLFVGPQEENKLAALAPGLELVKDYGYFKILAEPLFWLLTQLHRLIGNWGWAIVALVVLLKVALYWLNASAYRSMAKMKAVNPKIMEMRERLKDKPQQQQQEMMRIYREEKVNPIGGCLPIFAQMPIFIALYWVLLSSVEMRNAPWIGWITDLSAKDPYFILPLLMTASSLLQTWLNPTPPDPVQAKMMWIMPLVFSVMFFFFPAGLVLYYVTNNILSIAQQWLINKQLGVLGK